MPVAGVSRQDAAVGGAAASGSVQAVLKCVFVLRFDTNQGNVLEWTYPKNFLGMDGIEFKGIPSGLHTVTADRVFLKQAGYFGVACFNNTPTDEEGQRGARMCSVGCLMETAEGLYTIADELAEEAERQNQEAIDGPPVAKGSTYSGNYSRLQALFTAHKGTAPSLPPVLPTSASSFSSMVSFFGADTFLLWKAALLKKRILFFSPVPIEQGCMRVRWIDRMLGLQNGDSIAASSLMYYINVFDIDRLSTMDSYIACTSEKIFQEKPQLCVFHHRVIGICHLLPRTERYDLYVNNREITFSSPEVKNALVTTPIDSSRYALLTESTYAEQEDSESNLTRFFTRLNQELLDNVESLCALDRPASGASTNLSGGLLDTRAYRIKRSQLQEKTGLHRKDAEFLRSFAAAHNYRLQVDESPLDFCGCC